MNKYLLINHIVACIAVIMDATGETGCCLRGPRRGELGNEVRWALQGSLRRDGVIFELTVDKCSAQAAVKTEPKCVKLKNLQCSKPLPGNGW
jgi:hypothetical protein